MGFTAFFYEIYYFFRGIHSLFWGCSVPSTLSLRSSPSVRPSASGESYPHPAPYIPSLLRAFAEGLPDHADRARVRLALPAPVVERCSEAALLAAGGATGVSPRPASPPPVAPPRPASPLPQRHRGRAPCCVAAAPACVPCVPCAVFRKLGITRAVGRDSQQNRTTEWRATKWRGWRGRSARHRCLPTPP